MTPPTVVLVGADKGGVGKTMTARALLDYLAAHQVPVRVFDSQSGGDLIRFAPEATLIDLASVADQMKVFDGVSAETVTVVDICAGLLSPTLRALDEAQLLADVRSGAMRLVVLHVLGASMVSIGEIATASKSLGGAKHLIVKNHASATDFSEWDKGPAQAIFAKYSDVTITIDRLVDPAPKLLEMRAIEERGGSFLSFINDPGESRMMRGRVNSWLSRVWAEFERVNVRGPDVPSEGASDHE